uniref:DNAJ-containing protein X-domain domain-containing protein n=1 Tax=Moniliophthora roreri TaxID=221103 RepID=A0A0W0EW65_MONRR
MKDMTTAATTMMTDEEKAELEKQLNGEGPSTPGVTSSPHPTSTSAPTTPPATTAAPEETTTANAESIATAATTERPEATSHPSNQSSLVAHGEASSTTSPSPSTHSTKDSKEKERERIEREREATRKRKEKLREQERERRKVMEARVAMLTKKMVERLRPFVDAKHPGDKEDPETMAFEAKMKREAEDLKLESFGVELLHTIGNVYMMKATSFLKSRKFLGM